MTVLQVAQTLGASHLYSQTPSCTSAYLSGVMVPTHSGGTHPECRTCARTATRRSCDMRDWHEAIFSFKDWSWEVLGVKGGSGLAIGTSSFWPRQVTAI